MSTSTHRRFTPKHSTEGTIEHEIIENIYKEEFLWNPNPAPEETRAEKLGENHVALNHEVIFI